MFHAQAAGCAVTVAEGVILDIFVNHKLTINLCFILIEKNYNVVALNEQTLTY